MYNLTNLTANPGVVNVVSEANNYTGGVLVPLFVISIYFVLLISYSMKYDFAGGITVASWIVFVLSSLLVFVDFINILFPLGFLLLAAFGTFYLYTTK